ncbi:N(2),N(2)-dimethylguanosine tRNA methyltransferase [mine drainage metagenome]|uniref:tRNA (guanine(26)-N(2))-dimethyltransferase n=2 Tax=mine drainage metagenome TaxID=410659 RepID=T1BP54_9ZZZZ
MNRDVTISALKVLRPKRVLDGFGATGIRAIRFRLETGSEVHVSEINPVSLRIIEKNVRMNSTDVSVHAESFAETSRKIPFDYIDVDPYGSVVPHLDSAIINVKNKGYVGITATDLSVLTGSYPEKTIRRYNSVIVKDTFKHEKGLRLLLGYAARRSAAMDRYIRPIVSFWNGHYYRSIFQVLAGSMGADTMLSRVRHVNLHDLIGTYYPSREEGPLWTGEIEDNSFLAKMGCPDGEGEKFLALIALLRNEDKSLFFTDLQDVARCTRSDVMGVAKATSILEDARANGFRTHFSPTGIKSNIQAIEVFRMLSDHSQRQKQ